MTAAEAPTPFKHAPSRRSKRGMKKLRRLDFMYRLAIGHEGALKPPLGSATPGEPLDTRLRQCLGQQHDLVTVGCSGGAELLKAGTSTGRHQAFPAGWGVNRDQRYRSGHSDNWKSLPACAYLRRSLVGSHSQAGWILRPVTDVGLDR